jgi:uncharacterized protein (DUF2147 family)
MRTYCFAAALLMASTAAHAGNGISFRVNGQRVHIEAPRNCGSLSCIQVTAPGMSGNLKSLSSKLNTQDGDDDAPSPAPSTQSNATPPAQKTVPNAAAAQQTQAEASTAPDAPVARDSAPATATETSTVPLLHDVTPSASNSVPPPLPTTAMATPAPAAAVSPTAQPAAMTNAPVTPLGLWATQDNKGNVQIEPCGQNLCGYSEKTHEPVLINMRPSNDSGKWTGRIHDPEGGGNYDSTIAMKGPNLLKVQGCAFGGLFCGGQTWKRFS